MNRDTDKRITYRDAGVDISAGNSLVDRIKPIARRTQTAGVLSSLGGFGALFELPLERFKQPVLVSSTDGVGTKLNIAQQLGIHNTVGIDLVAMCVNDIIVQGAEPLFFLDYFATSALSVDVAAAVIEGIGRGCEMAGAALIGGETAEMPGMYAAGDYDLAGFSVGIAEKQNLIDGHEVEPGNALIGLVSSGPHSNGYSLIRKILEYHDISLDTCLGNQTLGEILLEPTRIYVKPLLGLMRHLKVNALAHITGGGISENLPRVLRDGVGARIDLSSWKEPLIFDWIQQQANIDAAEMLRTFNCGIGMIICVANEDADAAVEFLTTQGETAFAIGSLVETGGPPGVGYV